MGSTLLLMGAGPLAAGPPPDTTAPTITSASTDSVAENAMLSHALTADESVTWSIVGGADQSKFELSGSTLRWASNGTKDYEAPDDADTNNVYVVTVRATDGAGNMTDQTISVTVTNVAEGPSARYWRLYVMSMVYNTSTSTDQMVIPELEFRESIGGADTTAGKTYLSSSNYDTSPHGVSSAFDDNVTTIWAPTAGKMVAQWVGVDYGAGVTKNIVEVALKCNTVHMAEMPGACLLQYSDDGSTWITSFGFSTPNTWTASEVRTFSAPTGATAAHRYWRMFGAYASGSASGQNGQSPWAIAAVELEFRGSVGGADLTSPGVTTLDSGTDTGGAAANAFDNSGSTAWVGTHDAVRCQWVGVDFGAGNAQSVAQLMITSRGSGAGLQSPKEGLLEYADDGTTWYAAGWWQGFSWADSETRTVANAYV